MSDISVRTTTRSNEDQRWIGNGGKPIGDPRSILLDVSAFTGTYDEGFIPSGVTIGEITATGLYAPYAAAGADGTQTAAGHLFATVAVDSNSTGNIAAALFWSGEVIEEFLPADDTLDAAAKTDVANHIAYV